MSDRTVSVLRTHEDQVVPVAGVYDIDGAHTSVEFVGRHLMITKVRGRFSDVRGRITIAEEPEQSHVEVEIGAASLSTGNDDRDAHLRSGDFFDVEHYPTITFTSTAVTALPDHTWQVTGDLTVRDTTRPVTLQVDFDGADISPLGDERVGFSAATRSTGRTSGSPGTSPSRPADSSSARPPASNCPSRPSPRPPQRRPNPAHFDTERR
jgi:polyisoprenoid-binding protein YceI